MKFQDILNLNQIVFYDGECGFCNGMVQFILKYRKDDFYFISLQSETAKKLLSKYDIEINLDTLYLIKNKKLYHRSTAVLHIFQGLKGLFPFVYYVGWLFPKTLKDYFYMKISKSRHRIQPQNCFLPKKDERKFFIQYYFKEV